MTSGNPEKERLIKNLMDQGYLRTKKVISVFGKIPREEFVMESDRAFAYADYPLSILSGQTISAPHMVAIMTELLEPETKDKVLEIGAGSGYQAAILSKLVKKIYSIEVDPELVSFARSNLSKASVKNVEVIMGDGSKGYEKAKPYDKILVTCATPEIFDSWISQLKMNGILLAPVGGGFYQELMKIRKTKKGLEKKNHGGCAFVPLRT
ncbi:MAG: protein-L-isoaspartate(D-aspartate) O-methyltransferase [Candidatus Aenigmarchaeota archaeon]|nr:protein-L-isoaspartate(D-aspartate) O-methyltransferase [Candidatus Aenigmarchaeota archaeon]NIP40519.1 protein-L-isoaspartate(D-aspartate) O-methyltransferase [Candidatus Aenigmarchaeota archaeon]NIQ18364.1 protein-L-isoaspartate(D-aspartate) O-methyltransferase [Candidatus Aenigmarchaeota archaeon]